jgi:hypothetical protein
MSRRCPSRKLTFVSRAEAVEFIVSRREAGLPDNANRARRCHICHGWHTTSQPYDPDLAHGWGGAQIRIIQTTPKEGT